MFHDALVPFAERRIIKMNDKICFLILHYLAADTTKNCIESIKKNVIDTDYCIVVVDNGSNNNSGELLKKRYVDDEKVKVLLLKENLGFARGNNVGFKYAIEKEKCNYICMMNNDTLIKQRDFVGKIHEVYKNYKAAVIGPKIILGDGSINPIQPELGTIEHYKTTLLLMRASLIKTYLGIDDIKFSKILRKNKAIVHEKDTNKIYKDIILHGCCLIFTPKYINIYNGINSKTYMYREEELLFLRLKLSNLSSIYYPDLNIVHLEDVSTNMFMKKQRKKKIFMYKNQIKSLKVLINEMERNKIYDKKI